MIEKLTITILVNNYLNEAEVLGEHGLSLLVSFSASGLRKKILLDTGRTAEVLMGNTETMGISLDDLMAIVISHGHYDHTGGLLSLLRSLGRPIPVIVHPDAWATRINTKPHFRSISPRLTPSDLERAGGDVIAASNPIVLFEDILTTGSIERSEPWEQNDSLLRVRNGELVNDEVLDDLALIINLGDRGLFLVTGCCHAGIINTVRHAMKLTGNTKLKGIIGGLHLMGASEERLLRTVDYLKEITPEIVVPLHCSGQKESCLLRQGLGEIVKFMGAGEELPVL